MVDITTTMPSVHACPAVLNNIFYHRYYDLTLVGGKQG
jgi:hypothetical protein